MKRVIRVATLLLLVLVTVFFAALGRSATPSSERLPWWNWTLRDLTANVVQGGRLLVTLTQHQRRLLDRHLDAPQPWRRKSEGDGSDGTDDDRN